MSRVVSAGSTPTKSQQQPPSQPQGQTQQVKIPHEKIAMRAYEKWVQRGRPMGTDVQDWLDAERELRMEMTRSTGTGSTVRR